MENISLCESCFCMTKTVKSKCGKCGAKKENDCRKQKKDKKYNS